jgi:ABC-type transport system involved in multi-copper enzyme maturation permease subunit
MIGLIRSELRKLFTTQVWFWLLIGTLALTALGVVGTILSDGAQGNDNPNLSTVAGQRNLFAGASAGYIFVCVLGIVAMTAEYRHLTVTPTFLATPKRNLVIIAKLITYAVVGLGFAIVSALLVIAMALPWLSAKNVDVSLTANRIPLVLLAAVIVVAIYGIVGVGLGALIRNQIAAVSVTLVYLFILENILSVIPKVKEAYKFLPGGAANAVTQVSQNNTSLLEPWQGGLVLVGYGIVFAALAAWLTVRRDVT